MVDKNDKQKVVTELPKLDLALINQVYFGMQGCACGCRGNYHETLRMKKVAVAKLAKRASDGLQIITGLAEDKSILSWEGEDRAIRIYTQQDLMGD